MPRDHRRYAVAEPPASTEGQRECHRGDWCEGYRLVPAGDGTSKRAPGLTYQAFCQADTARIAGCLDPDEGLPAAYRRLEQDIGDPARRGEMIRVPFGPKMVLSEYYDTLMRRIVEVLCSYEERVRTIGRLVPLDTKGSALRANRHGARVTADAARTLAHEQNLSALLALPAGPMFRHIPSPELKAATGIRAAGPVLELWQEAIVYGNGYGTATILVALSGASAGIEILDLQRRCLSALGEVATRPEVFDGVPCRVCGTMGLERAEPPSDPEREADHSRCPDMSCGDRMNLETYRQWVTRYNAWARDLGPLTCARCNNGDCGQCVYTGCDCAAAGHPNAA